MKRLDLSFHNALIKHPETGMSGPRAETRTSEIGGKYSTKELASQILI
jgi:hypothetical protein